MEGDIDDGNDKAEFEVVIRHTCHTDGRRRKFKGEDAKVDIAHGDSYLFKASHLGDRPGVIQETDTFGCTA
ncbi:hypothetical protein L3Y34_000162 [Caenorhabditis briggsae]|nr:hypothetical protein L3Y34_000162 [Caenorhabditis briggsae]